MEDKLSIPEWPTTRSDLYSHPFYTILENVRMFPWTLLLGKKDSKDTHGTVLRAINHISHSNLSYVLHFRCIHWFNLFRFHTMWIFDPYEFRNWIIYHGNILPVYDSVLMVGRSKKYVFRSLFNFKKWNKADHTFFWIPDFSAYVHVLKLVYGQRLLSDIGNECN